MNDPIESAYQDGYSVGIRGIKAKSPDELSDYAVRDQRDAWVDGYMDGWRLFKQQMGGRHLGAVAQDPAVTGRLFVEPKRNGCIRILDCEGGEELAIVQIDGEPEVRVYDQVLSAEMAYVLARALMKAAALAYRVRQSRVYRPATTHDMVIFPTDERSDTD